MDSALPIRIPSSFAKKARFGKTAGTRLMPPVVTFKMVAIGSVEGGRQLS